MPFGDGPGGGQPDAGTTSGPADPQDDGGSETGDGVAGGFGFIADEDLGNVTYECSLWDQNCDVGEKCSLWANDGGTWFNATKCVPVHPQPDPVGSSCWADPERNGMDSCEFGAFCWDADPETNIGMCVAFCLGSEANPICDNPGEACSVGKEFSICLPRCDPLIGDCPVGCACYGISDDFQCVPDASGDLGAAGDPCEFINTCDPGLACLAAEGVPGCAGSSGCCSPYCDLSKPSNCMPGQACVPWFEEGSAPPGYDNVGVCFVPS